MRKFNVRQMLLLSVVIPGKRPGSHNTMFVQGSDVASL